MTDQGEQTSRKLVYLRDHTPRLRSRQQRQERRAAPSPPTDLASEAAWLGRCLLFLTAATLIYWLAVVTGVARPADDATWHWTLSHVLAHLFLAASAALAARVLIRNGARAPLFVAVVAGAAVVIALEGLTRMVVVGGLSEISLGARSDILTKAAVLALGIWCGSYALRADRREG